MKRERRWILWLGVALLAALGIVREAYDPFLALFIGDVLNPKPPPLHLDLPGDYSFLLYEDTRPHIGKIDALQKGLVLVSERNSRYGRLIEEGYGFGLPIIQYEGLAYVSRHADVAKPAENVVVKRYVIDVADRWSRFLRIKYLDVPPLGTVVTTYTVVAPETLSVTVDFTGLDVAWDKAYLMNEQGARAFPVYENSVGVRQHGDALGIWHPEDDVFGCWVSRDATVRFCVETEPGRRRFVGRERYNQYNWVGIYVLSWSGIDIEIDAPLDRYSYQIRVEALPGDE
ncbi:MAG: hypothetical protein JXB35_18715 [Anaerolineae bacterium]|nr:hypothetical protein [Anaerolineae bacterium]